VKFLALTFLCLGVAAAQGPDTFEVASIKLGDPLAQGTSLGPQNGGGLKMENMTLRQMVQWAYDLREFQVTGATGWMNSERYRILAKGVLEEGPATYAGMNDAQRRAAWVLIRKRLKNLLAERFQLVVHTETKELPMYALVEAKGGVKMQPNTAPDGSPQTMMVNTNAFEATRASLDSIAQNLAGITGRPVQNETGLTGYYNFKMKWTPDAAPGAPDKPAEAAAGPTLFTALQEQLGLKLESKKGPVEILVIDRAERPTEN